MSRPRLRLARADLETSRLILKLDAYKTACAVVSSISNVARRLMDAGWVAPVPFRAGKVEEDGKAQSGERSVRES